MGHDAPTSAILSHVVQSVMNDIQLLEDHGVLSRADAGLILSKLQAASPASGYQPTMPVPSSPSMYTTDSSVPSTPELMHSRSASAAGMGKKRAVPPPPMNSATPGLPQVRALWDYSASESTDLSFSKGDIIEVIVETNADWWEGKVQGTSKKGLFPANHVERIHAPPPGPPPGDAPAFQPYRSTHANMQHYDNNGVNQVGLAPPQEDQAKKSKFGKLGSTMASSAAGGVGFGAGAAIGGGLVRAIF